MESCSKSQILKTLLVLTVNGLADSGMLLKKPETSAIIKLMEQLILESCSKSHRPKPL